MRAGRSARGWSRGTLLGVVLAATLPARAGLAQPAPSAEVKAGARAAAERGSAEFKAGHYKEALDLILRAESLIHAPTHLLMLGRSYAALGQLVQAKETYLKATREDLPSTAPPVFKRAQSDAAKELQELEPRIPSVQISVTGGSPPHLVVTMDGAPVPAALVGIPHPMDPGKHAFRASADGFQSPEKVVVVKESDQLTVQLDLKASASAVGPVGETPVGEPPPRDAPTPAPGGSKRLASFALMGVGAAGIGVGAAFSALYFSKRGEANAAFDKCGVGCTGAPADNVRAIDSNANTKGTVAVIGFVAGGALAVGGVTLFVLSRRAPSTAAAAWKVAPWVGAGSAGASGAF